MPFLQRFGFVGVKPRSRVRRHTTAGNPTVMSGK